MKIKLTVGEDVYISILNDSKAASGLIKLGKFEAGIEKFANMKSNFKVTIEKMD